MRGQYLPLGILRFLYHLPNFARLFWRLLRDPRVPAYKKILPVITGICIAYIISPYDLVPDTLPLIGQLEDLAILVLIVVPSIRLFVRICPREVVREHTSRINGGVS
jgi:uncharacterized membrane protein YkvA (DUF1232 family)